VKLFKSIFSCTYISSLNRIFCGLDLFYPRGLDLLDDLYAETSSHIPPQLSIVPYNWSRTPLPEVRCLQTQINLVHSSCQYRHSGHCFSILRLYTAAPNIPRRIKRNNGTIQFGSDGHGIKWAIKTEISTIYSTQQLAPSTGQHIAPATGHSN
jgi:hypothetical protein